MASASNDFESQPTEKKPKRCDGSTTLFREKKKPKIKKPKLKKPLRKPKQPKLNDYGGKKEERCDDSSSVTPDDRDSEIEHYDDEKIVYYKDGFHKRTRKETDMYNERIRATGGFDAPYFPKAIVFSAITPIRGLHTDKVTLEHITKCSKIALDNYNEGHKNDADYEFVKVCKATAKGVTGFIYYLTFEAKDGESGQSQIFQAKVWWAIRDIKVISCGPKHSSSV